MAGGGVRVNGVAAYQHRRDRAIKLIKQGLDNKVICERLGMRSDRVSEIRKEVEASADRGS